MDVHNGGFSCRNLRFTVFASSLDRFIRSSNIYIQGIFHWKGHIGISGHQSIISILFLSPICLWVPKLSSLFIYLFIYLFMILHPNYCLVSLTYIHIISIYMLLSYTVLSYLVLSYLIYLILSCPSYFPLPESSPYWSIILVSGAPSVSEG